MAREVAIPIAMSSQALVAIIAGIAGVLGAGIGAAATGLVTAWTARTDRGNKWRQFERGNARAFMEHIAVHRDVDEDGGIDEDDQRLIGHYYRLALAVSDDSAAVALYRDLPNDLRKRVHDPSESPFKELRDEVTPGRRKALAPPGETTA
jgi:hypothetical protein